MDFEFLLKIIGDEPVFETSLLLAGNVNAFDVRKQLDRWKSSGKIYQLRRGLYCLAPPYQKVIPHPFLVANKIRQASYVSLQSALNFHGMIPEGVPVITSVTTNRPQSFTTPIGRFDFHHLQVNWFMGYTRVDLGNGQGAFVAAPEKSLLDLIYLQPGGETIEYLRSLRLQALDQLNVEKLFSFAADIKKPKLLRALEAIKVLIEEEEGYQPL